MPLRAAFSACRVHLVNTLARPLFQVMIVVQPIAMVLLTNYVYRGAGGDTSFYVVLGSGLSAMWVATAFSSAGDLNRERTYGTIQPVLLSAVPLWIVSMGRVFGALILSVIPVGVSALMAFLVLGTRLPDTTSVPGVLLGVAAYAAGCHGFGLVLGHLFMLSRRTAVLQNFLEWPILILSGVIFPVHVLPRAAEWVAAILPMRWGAEVAARSVDGGIAWHLLGIAVGLAAAYLVAAVLLLRVVERRVRVTASLEVA